VTIAPCGQRPRSLGAVGSRSGRGRAARAASTLNRGARLGALPPQHAVLAGVEREAVHYCLGRLLVRAL